MDVFLPYAKDYATTFSRQSITTEQWKDHLYAYWSKNGGSEKTKILDGVDWNVSQIIIYFIHCVDSLL